MSYQDTPSVGEDNPSFDVLRAQLELGLVRPAVIAVTSATAKDGKEIAARGLAYSLARTGYSTLVIDTSPTDKTLGTMCSAVALDEVIRLQLAAMTDSGSVAMLELNDPILQRTTSQQGVDSALGLLRLRFDYVLISTALLSSLSFATSILASADAVIVTVKTGRRQRSEDARLSDLLKRIDSRFIGVVAIDGALIKDSATILLSEPTLDSRHSDGRNDTSDGERERQPHKIARSIT